MHECEVNDLLNELFAFDQAFFKHIFKTAWQEPTIELFEKTDDGPLQECKSMEFDLESFIHDFNKSNLQANKNFEYISRIEDKNVIVCQNRSSIEKFRENQQIFKSKHFKHLNKLCLTSAQSNLIHSDVDQLYWSCFGEIFNENRVQLWLLLYQGLKKYLKLLNARDKLINDYLFMQCQNNELRHCLQNVSANETQSIQF